MSRGQLPREYAPVLMPPFPTAASAFSLYPEPNPPREPREDEDRDAALFAAVKANQR